MKKKVESEEAFLQARVRSYNINARQNCVHTLATAVAAAPASAPRAKFTADIECSIDIASSALTHCAGEVRDGRLKRRDALLWKSARDHSTLRFAVCGRPTDSGLTHSGVVTEFRIRRLEMTARSGPLIPSASISAPSGEAKRWGR